MSFITNLTTGLIVAMALIIVFSSYVLSPMNDIYNQSYSTGMNTSILDTFQGARTGADTQLGTGNTETTAQGLTLTSTWSAVKVIYTSLTSFLSGEFLWNLIVDTLQLPEILAIIAVLSMWILLIFAIIKLFMKVQA